VAVDYFDHIETREGVLGGKPVIKGTRIAVELLLDLLAAGWSVEDIVREYPSVQPDDLRAIFALAAELVKEERFIIESKVA
jgi:uncharacterized protein (DUF433 family)